MNASYSEYALVFKAISDETRLKIVDMLSCGELCACNILEEFSISQPTLSYHMRILTDSGLVNARRDGAWMKYTLNRQKTSDALLFYTNLISAKEDCICKTGCGMIGAAAE